MSGFQVCGSCFGLYGKSGDRRQLCACAAPEEHQANGEARYQSAGTYWTRLAEICRCCGAALVTADHKFAVWFCRGCLKPVREVNKACGSCVIPIGWHSIVNGVFAPTNRMKTVTGATAVADELGAFFRESVSVSEWGTEIVKRHWLTAGLPLGQDVSVKDYQNAVRATAPDKTALFDELAAARGIPPHWRS
jgi:hypothetical protein